jgi:hypothetical protein
MAEQQVLKILRYMAWERALGELNSMLQSYVGNEEKFHKMKEEIEKFKNNIIQNGIHE